MPTIVTYSRVCDQCSVTESTETLNLPDNWPLVAYGGSQRYTFCSWSCLANYALDHEGDLTPPDLRPEPETEPEPAGPDDHPEPDTVTRCYWCEHPALGADVPADWLRLSTGLEDGFDVVCSLDCGRELLTDALEA